jgi:predicted Co/Zn/Cd cation transporter (cation efflux family)
MNFPHIIETIDCCPSNNGSKTSFSHSVFFVDPSLVLILAW